MSDDLTGRVAIVSGAGPGLGRSVALLLAEAGADVVVAARDAERIDAVAAEVEGAGRKALAVRTDITVAADCQALVDAAVDRFGRLDVLVNNAFAMGPMAAMLDVGLDGWREAMDVNLFGTMELSLAATRVMAEAGGGSIVMVSSQAMRRSAPRRGAYAASKAALLAATRVLANEVGRVGVRVNSVVPGQIWGPALEQFYDDVAKRRGVTPEEVYDDIAKDTALRRIPTADEVAEAVVFLASDRARGITGQALDVNAGNWWH
jgi:NAD(P)-dependent dehydrogenase (short-subunit alcohol dehydrogenase family)